MHDELCSPEDLHLTNVCIGFIVELPQTRITTVPACTVSLAACATMLPHVVPASSGVQLTRRFPHAYVAPCAEYLVCRYLFRRCDNEPAPWSANDIGDPAWAEDDLPADATAEILRCTEAVTYAGEAPYWTYDTEKGAWGWARPPPAGGAKKNARGASSALEALVRKNRAVRLWLPLCFANKTSFQVSDPRRLLHMSTPRFFDCLKLGQLQIARLQSTSHTGCARRYDN